MTRPRDAYDGSTRRALRHVTAWPQTVRTRERGVSQHGTPRPPCPWSHTHTRTQIHGHHRLTPLQRSAEFSACTIRRHARTSVASLLSAHAKTLLGTSSSLPTKRSLHRHGHAPRTVSSLNSHCQAVSIRLAADGTILAPLARHLRQPHPNRSFAQPHITGGSDRSELIICVYRHVFGMLMFLELNSVSGPTCYTPTLYEYSRE